MIYFNHEGIDSAISIREAYAVMKTCCLYRAKNHCFVNGSYFQKGMVFFHTPIENPLYLQIAKFQEGDSVLFQDYAEYFDIGCYFFEDFFAVERQYNPKNVSNNIKNKKNERKQLQTIGAINEWP
jgi:hypothetical protein